MRVYRYTAVDRDGVRQTGEVVAASMDAAQRILDERGLMVGQLDDISLGTADIPTPASTGLRAASQPLMAVMSLRALSEELPRTTEQQAINHLASALHNGTDIHSALTDVQGDLPPRLRHLIDLGIKTQRLDWFVAHYLDSTRRISESRHRLLSAVGYPAVTGLVVAAIACFFLLLIVPMFARMFQDFGMQVPQLTTVIIFLSDSLRGGILGFLLLVVLACGVALLLTRIVGGSTMVDQIVASVPVLGAPLRYLRLSEFCELLALLVEARTPLNESLRLLAGTIGNDRMARGAEFTAALVERGVVSPSAAELRGSGWPTELGDVFRWSARSEDFVQGLRAASDIFRARSRVQGNLCAWLLEPILLLMLSIGVGLLVIALFMPLINLLNALA